MKPGDTIGILGGGQLGRMLALAAAPLGLKSHVFAPERDSPAFDVAARQTIAAYEDEAALAAFADQVQAVTFEFENVPAATAAFLAARVPLHPGAKALAITQDRWTEKNFVAGLGIETARFMKVDDAAGVATAMKALGTPAVLKTRRLGYDGKGQVLLREGDSPTEAFTAIGRAPAIVEAFVPFDCEISVVGARGADGRFVAYDVCLNEHRDHILARTLVPADTVPPGARADAATIAGRIAAALDYRGVLAVEMFVVRAGAFARVVVNEIAPRVHNSGHWTIEGAECSQFEQHIRAVASWPLGPAGRRGAWVVMTNLIGEAAHEWPSLLAEPGAHLHLYGKGEARAGRKMGHVTRIFSEAGPPGDA